LAALTPEKQEGCGRGDASLGSCDPGCPAAANDGSSTNVDPLDSALWRTVMPDDSAIIEPTSTATTRQTEPEVVAGISSAEGSPDRPLWFGIAGAGIGMGHMLLMLGAGVALGYGGYRLWQARGSIS
jgi:hypothetical protein